MKLAVAASSEFVDLDDGWPTLRQALVEEGFEAQVVVWDDSMVDWGRFDLVAAMYTWGYVTRRKEFLTWADEVGAVTSLANSAAHLSWSSDKTYLRDLATLGIPVVPTSWVRLGDEWTPPAGDYIIKPTVASGGLGAARYSADRHGAGSDRAAEAHVRRLHRAGQTVMVQPYQHSVDTAGETALVYLGDSFSHAIKKSALLVADAGETDRLWERETTTATEATPDQRDLANAVMAAVAANLGPTAYARVDLVDDQGGRPGVLEVELIEPSLFLRTADGSALRLAAALRRLVAHKG